MAQLPPRAPSAAPQDHWPPAAGEFLGFAAARRGAHRRSASDSAAFLEAVPIDDDVVIGGGGGGGDDFDRLDHDQLLSMFSDVDVSVSVSVSGSAGERAQLMDAGGAGADDGVADSSPAAADGVAEPKRVKRILANRQSAQRSRVRKLQYISELERSVTSLQMEVSALSPRVAFLDHHRSLLTVGNSHLKQRIAALAQDKIFKDGTYRCYQRPFCSVLPDRASMQRNNMIKPCSSPRGAGEGDPAAAPSVPAAAGQGGHHRRRRHRHRRLAVDAGQARAARVRGRCYSIAEAAAAAAAFTPLLLLVA
uniref:BZIP domain-containing protein n=1 Tax=Zea mays TaxID=4577 RepID=A0A804P2R2_MAIZE